MKNIDKILEYIRNVKVEEIDWSKLFGSYSCGIKIGEDIKNNNLLAQDYFLSPHHLDNLLHS